MACINLYYFKQYKPDEIKPLKLPGLISCYSWHAGFNIQVKASFLCNGRASVFRPGPALEGGPIKLVIGLLGDTTRVCPSLLILKVAFPHHSR